MTEQLSVDERIAEETKEQDQGIADMVKALNVGPVEDKDKDNDKDKDDNKDKDQDQDKDNEDDDKDDDKNDDKDDDDKDVVDDKDNDPDSKDDDDKEDDDKEDKDKEDKDDDDKDKDKDKDDDKDDREEEDDDIKLQLEILRAENEALKGGVKKDTKGDDDLGITSIKDLKDIDFLGGDDEDDDGELTLTKEGLNKLLNAVRTQTTQEMMVTLPNLAANLVHQKTVLDKAVTKFYDDNKDLAKHKDYVALIAQSVQSDHPGLNYETMFKLVEKTVRKNLNLKKKVEDIRSKEKDKDKGGGKKRSDKSNPALDKKGAGGGGTGRREKEDTRTPQQKEISKMLEAVE